MIRGKDEHSTIVEDIHLFYKSMHTSCKPNRLGQSGNKYHPRTVCPSESIFKQFGLEYKLYSSFNLTSGT